VYQFATAHKKPFFLAEFAIRHDGTQLTHAQQVRWFRAMFDYFDHHPQIKAISYFNYKNSPDPTPDRW
jgi:Glycosyl hydrolase catalytic core.